MDRREIERVLIETIREVQEVSGEEAIEISLNTCPIEELGEFDSLRGAETTVLLSGKLKLKFSAGSGDVNVFVSKDGRRALRLHEVVGRLTELIE